jgi:hypothetical protein
MTFGHIRAQNNQAKGSKSYQYTFSKKERKNNSKDGMLMAKISEGYYGLKRYKSLTALTLILSGQIFLTVSHQQI